LNTGHYRLGAGFLLVMGFCWASLCMTPPKTMKQVKPASYTETIPGTQVKFDMVAIPGGKYRRGSPENETGRNADEGPMHEIDIKPFWMGKCEVTWDEYDLFAFSLDLKRDPGAKPQPDPKVDAITRPTPPYTDMTFGHGHDGNPAICMTHHAAVEYCRWLSARTGKTYRLPTEAEWEYACRAGTTTAYSFGDDPTKLGDYGWSAENADAKPRPVGKKKPNPWGLHDMHGNVAEWCLDHYGKETYAECLSKGLLLNPFQMPTEKRFSHVVRGGSWDDDPPALRSAARRGSIREWLRQDPQRPQSIWWLTEAEYVGLRVVRSVEEAENLKNLRSKVTKNSPY
jgi:formylglycine-generating enzyme required for sulfatase activity